MARTGRPPITKDSKVIEQVYELFLKGLTQDQISATLGHHVSIIRRIQQDEKFVERWKDDVSPIYTRDKINIAQVGTLLLTRAKGIAESENSTTKDLNIACDMIDKIFLTLQKIYDPEAITNQNGPKGYDMSPIIDQILGKK